MLSEEEFMVLDYMDIFKNVDEASLQEDTGLDPEKLSAILKKFSEKGYISKIMEGMWQIESAGEEEAAKYRKKLLEESGRKEEILKYCQEFEEINKRFKELVTRWQMKEEDGVMVPNDHKDPDYDFKIIEELTRIHEETKNLINKISEIIPMYRRYISRFENALNQLMDGKLDYMDRARDSYHNIWFELHESLLKLSGMQRVE